MDKGASRAIVHGVAKSQTTEQLSMHACMEYRKMVLRNLFAGKE